MKHLQCVLCATLVAAVLGGSASAGTVRACERVVAASISALDLALYLALSFTPIVAMVAVALWLWQQPSPMAAYLRRCGGHPPPRKRAALRATSPWRSSSTTL